MIFSVAAFVIPITINIDMIMISIIIITDITIWLQAWNVNWETGHMMVQLGTGENVIFQVGLHLCNHCHCHHHHHHQRHHHMMVQLGSGEKVIIIGVIIIVIIIMISL